MDVKIIKGDQFCHFPELVKQILVLDKENMLPILQSSGISNFNWDQRIKGLHIKDTVFIGVFDDVHCLGYIEFTKDWNDPNNIYLVSVQIKSNKRNSSIFKILVLELIEQLDQIPFNYLTSHVQKSNQKMIKMFSKFGFTINEQLGKSSLEIIAPYSLLTKSKLRFS